MRGGLSPEGPFSGLLFYGEDPTQGPGRPADSWGMRRLLVLAVLLALAVLSTPVGARAAVEPGFRAVSTIETVGAPVVEPESPDERPPGFTTTARQAMQIAVRIPAVAEEARHHGARFHTYVYGGSQWEINLLTDRGVVATVAMDPAGRVLEVWTGLKAMSPMARQPLDPLFDHVWVWLPFGLLFLLPFVDLRRPRRLLHLDLLALLSFGISYACFEHGRVDASVVLFYPPLFYLLGRMLIAGFRPRRGGGRLVPMLPTAALLVGVVALFGARVALNVTSDRSMDIGYASVVGADRIAHKQQLYADNDNHGDTYGPINYLAYVPFELAFPWHGVWDSLPAAHAAAIFFDLMTLLGLFLLGRQMRAGPEGRRLGLALAWAWAACPFTLLQLMDIANDGLVAMLLVWTLVVLASPAARGGIGALAAGTKFTPGALILLLARGRGGEGRRAWWTTVAVFTGVFAFTMAMYWPAGGLSEVWNCTLGFQLRRRPDFSLWALTDNWDWTQKLLEACAIGLALLVGLKPGGRRTTGQIAALAAAITIAVQIPAGHWFFFYIVWFMPLVLVALFVEHRDAAAVAAVQEPDEKPAQLGGVGLDRVAA
jgi:hypothetical protein